MNSKKPSLENDYHNGIITLLFFFGTILFSLTMYRFIWSIETFSRVVNSLLLLFGVLYFIKNLSHNKYHSKIWTNIIIPGFLIVIGMTLNILISSFSDINILSSLGSVLPWVVLLMIPDLYRQKKIDIIKLWKYSYYFMVGAVSLGFLDYVIIFVLGGDSSILKTSYGVFLAGKFSLFHMLNDGTAHYRFYSCFGEPGSLAMLLLPFIAYAAYKKKIIGLIILLIGLYLTDSLGGYISGLIMLLIMGYFKFKKNIIIFFSVLILSSIFLGPITYQFISKSYEARSQSGSYETSSAEIRESNFINGISKVPFFIFNKPFGIKLSSNTEGYLKNKNYVGSNFLPITYLQTGGLIAFIGYLIILYTSIKTALKILMKYNYMTVEYKVVALSLIVFIPFLMQRTTIWETAWFALLYIPIIIDNLKKNLYKE